MHSSFSKPGDLTGETDRERLDPMRVFHDVGTALDPQQMLPGGHDLHEWTGLENDLRLSEMVLEPGKELIGQDEGCIWKNGSGGAGKPPSCG